MNIKQLVFLLVTITFSLKGFSQPLSAYTNFQKQFIVWDNGITRSVESLIPVKVEIGRVAIPYLDNSRNFKIFYNGGSQKINDGFTRDFQVTDNLLTYQNANALWVWEQGERTLLSNYCEQFFTGDSIVVFFDGVQKEFRAYYDGRIYPIEGFLAANISANIFDVSGSNARVSEDMQIASGQLPSVKVASNIAAYVNYNNQFNVFYQGLILNLEDYMIENFDVARNIVAYTDANREFKIFHKGKVELISELSPENYAAGNDLVAFVDNDRNFKIFYNDSIYNLGYLQPDYLVKDNIVAFTDATGYFKVFYKGVIYNIDNYFPSEIKLGYNSVAYINSSSELKLFSEGEMYTVTSGIAKNNWRLDYDVVQYQFGANMFKVFYKGRTY